MSGLYTGWLSANPLRNHCKRIEVVFGSGTGCLHESADTRLARRLCWTEQREQALVGVRWTCPSSRLWPSRLFALSVGTNTPSDSNYSRSGTTTLCLGNTAPYARGHHPMAGLPPQAPAVATCPGGYATASRPCLQHSRAASPHIAHTQTNRQRASLPRRYHPSPSRTTAGSGKVSTTQRQYLLDASSPDSGTALAILLPYSSAEASTGTVRSCACRQPVTAPKASDTCAYFDAG